MAVNYRASAKLLKHLKLGQCDARCIGCSNHHLGSVSNAPTGVKCRRKGRGGGTKLELAYANRGCATVWQNATAEALSGVKPPLAKKWRRGWDSNPRYACTHAGFQDRCIQPLCHLSGSHRAWGPGRLTKTLMLDFDRLCKTSQTFGLGGAATIPQL